jgi:cellulose synthase/poly-beta-1,6-N-acetylglucosamine synthase-like glycosyltransferase
MAITIAEVIFWISIYAIAHSYIFYPVFMQLFAFRKENNKLVYTNLEHFPEVTIIMAVHNAEKVIEKKIRSVFETGYELNKITFLIGSDASTDKTDEIIIQCQKQYQGISFKRFETRQGKVKIINELESVADSEILIFTDVHAFLNKDSIQNLVKHFYNPAIKVVGGRLQSLKLGFKEIAYQESFFMKEEFKLKYCEGKMWGSMIGAYGAFYAIRKSSYHAIPDNFLVDDFYISLKAIEKGGKAICDNDAVVFENVAGLLYSEFKRKIRISMGNFQNLSVLYPILFQARLGLAFSFFSHKVLRWFGPLFLISILFSSFFIFRENIFYTILFIIMLLSISAPLIDYFSRKIQFHVIILRFITHFYFMNLALLIGLFKYMKGVKTNVWEPTQRE